jgi:ABC-type transporter Mla subunit MlaD
MTTTFMRALDQQLTEQRSLNRLLARVEEALVGVHTRMDVVEQRLAGFERAVQDVAGFAARTGDLTATADTVLRGQAAALDSLRATLSTDLAATTAQVEQLVTAVQRAGDELTGHVAAAAASVTDTAVRLETAAADHAAAGGATVDAAHGLREAAVVLRGAHSEITDALARLADGLDRAVQQAVRAARVDNTDVLEPALARLEQLGDAFVERLASGQLELACPTCGFVAKSAAGLAAHRRRHR